MGKFGGLLVVLILPSLLLADKGDFYIGGGPSFSFLEPETSGTSFSVDDDTDTGGKVFLGYDLARACKTCGKSR